MKKVVLIIFALIIIGATVFALQQPQSDNSPLKKMAKNAEEWQANQDLIKNWSDSNSESNTVTFKCIPKENRQYAIKARAYETADPKNISIVVYRENKKGIIKKLEDVSPYWNGKTLYYQTYEINHRCTSDDICYISITIKDKSVFKSVTTKTLGYGVVNIECTKGGTLHSPFITGKITEIEMISEIGGLDLCPDPEDGYLFRGFFYNGKKVKVFETYDNQYVLLYEKRLEGKTVTAKFVPISGKYKQLADTEFTNINISSDYILTWDTKSKISFPKYNLLFYNTANPGHQLITDTTEELYYIKDMQEITQGDWVVEITGETTVDGQSALTPKFTQKFKVN